MKKFIIVFVILAAIGASIVILLKQREKEDIAVTTGKSSRGNITSVVTATGKIYPEVEVRISSEVAGEIVDLPIRDGQEVKRGELLVRVNPNTLEAQVKQQEAALRASEANSSEANSQMLQSKLNQQRTENLFSKGFATQEQVDLAHTEYEVAQASYQATLSRIEQQEMSLQEARDTLAKASTFSPIDGTITTLSSELGDRVVGTGQFEGTEIMRVADLTAMEVRVDVSETDIVSVSIGDKASIEIDALSDKEFEGVVTEIANSAAEENGSEQLTTFEVKVKLLEPSIEIRPGMTATADIKTKTVNNVVRVPLQSVTVRSKVEVAEQLGEKTEEPQKPEGGNKPEAKGEGPRQGGPGGRPGGGGGSGKVDNLQRVVFTVKDGKVSLCRVETGIADKRWIEITKGLEADVEIVTGSYRVLSRELKHDSKITIETLDNKEKRWGQ